MCHGARSPVNSIPRQALARYSLTGEALIRERSDAQAERTASRPTGSARWRAGFSLLHPGPSLLVTACFVAAAAAARHRLPDPLTGLRLVAVMLPLQFAIGAFNDLRDQEDDRAGKPGKPLARGAVSPAFAVAASVLGFGVALVMAATFPLPTLPLAGACAAAGTAYDLGLKRGALSWLPFWVGFACLPLTAGAAVGELSARVVLAAPPLALALALSVQLANALPDIEADRRSGSAGLAVRLDAVWARRLSLGLGALAGLAAVAAAPALAQPVAVVAAGAVPLVGAVLLLAVHPLPRPFPLLAPAVGVLAAVWLLALP